ncbi:MAG: Endopeptidase Clp ATP-binding chain [Candidatus Moranbacteria bacterium GW2011_GWF1_44_4]|nr:MAG: Endopeptidase Clp ATP-binding chain [Candidatus Moranbacteria bacterium GW2011_GWF1_44_4]
MVQVGIHPAIWAQNFVINCLTRLIGAIVRSGLITVGIFVELAALAFGIIFLIEWLFLPLFLALTLILMPQAFAKSLIWGLSDVFLLLSTVWILSFSYRLYRENKFDYSSMGINDLAAQEWFGRVWMRIGGPPGQSTAEALDKPDLLGRFLENRSITKDDFQSIIGHELLYQIEKENKKKFWLKRNLYSKMPIGKSWTYAYTVNLDKYSTDLSESDSSEYRNEKLIGRDENLHMLELILSRPKQNNVFIVGEVGIGRHALIHELAKRVRENTVSDSLLNKRILEVKLGEILAGGQNISILRKMFFEAAYAGNIILVIDDIDRHLKSSPHEASEDISGVLLEFLNYPTFQVVGITTPDKYHMDVEKNEGVTKYFEKIQIAEPGKDMTMEVLLDKLRDLEKDRIIFSYQALREIIKLSDRYLVDAPFPEKAVDLMEEVLLYWRDRRKGEIIMPEVVDEVVSRRVHVSIGDIGKSEKEKLLNLEEILHGRIVGQDLAVKQIAETVRRARIGMTSESKPMGSFLFLGPTGVGKTETAKALAEAYFGDENRMIRMDMSEYQKIDSIDRLIGDAATGKPGILENKVKENPYALLLLDEIEKSHPDILNLFLQILDEGWLTDAFGKKINFKNQIIIATSNAGSEIITEAVESKISADEIQKKVINFVMKEGIFRPELLNRFEGVIFFRSLTLADLAKVTSLILNKYALRLEKEKNIRIIFDPAIVEKIVSEGNNPLFGARAINRYVEDKIGDKVVKKIIAGDIKEATEFTFGPADIDS